MSIIEHHIRISKRARYYTIGERAGASDVWIVCHGYGQLAGRFLRHFEPGEHAQMAEWWNRALPGAGDVADLSLSD